MTCPGVIALSHPTGRQRVRGFQPPWYTVFTYTCPVCQRPLRVKANSFVGIHRTPAGHLAPNYAVPSRGGVICGAKS